MPSTTRIGDYAIQIGFDEELGLYVGTVANRPYGVRLTGRTRAQLTSRFERLFTSYIGLRAA